MVDYDVTQDGVLVNRGMLCHILKDLVQNCPLCVPSLYQCEVSWAWSQPWRVWSQPWEMWPCLQS